MIQAVEVKKSNLPEAGDGLFAKAHFKKGDLVCEYTGKVLTLLQALKLHDKRYLMGGFGLNSHIDAKDSPDCFGRYINDPINESLVNVEFVKLKKEKKALVKATRNIQVCSNLTPQRL